MKEWTLTKVYKCIPFSCDKNHQEIQKEGNFAIKSEVIESDAILKEIFEPLDQALPEIWLISELLIHRDH